MSLSSIQIAFNGIKYDVIVTLKEHGLWEAVAWVSLGESADCEGAFCTAVRDLSWVCVATTLEEVIRGLRDSIEKEPMEQDEEEG
jgi:hypothetical protein